MRVNEVKTKKGVDLLQHLVEYYHAQHKYRFIHCLLAAFRLFNVSDALHCSYFQDGLKSLEHISSYIQTLTATLHKIRQKQEEERKQLADIRNLLKSSAVFDKEVGGEEPHVDAGG